MVTICFEIHKWRASWGPWISSSCWRQNYQITTMTIVSNFKNKLWILSLSICNLWPWKNWMNMTSVLIYLILLNYDFIQRAIKQVVCLLEANEFQNEVLWHKDSRAHQCIWLLIYKILESKYLMRVKFFIFVVHCENFINYYCVSCFIVMDKPSLTTRL